MKDYFTARQFAALSLRHWREGKSPHRHVRQVPPQVLRARDGASRSGIRPARFQIVEVIAITHVIVEPRRDSIRPFTWICRSASSPWRYEKAAGDEPGRGMFHGKRRYG